MRNSQAFFFKLPIKGIFVLLLLVSQSSLLFSQKKMLEQADGFFYNKQYTEAFALYSKLYDKKPDNGLLLKMGDCCYNHDNFRDAKKYYSVFFSDTFYIDIPQFEWYAKSCKQSGEISLASKLYKKLYENKNDVWAKYYYEVYKLYSDSLPYSRTFNLDSNYNCLVLDATESVDPEAAPMWYIWEFADGMSQEGLVVEHCFDKPGPNKITLNIKDQKTGVVRYSDTALVVNIENPPVKFSTPKYAKQYFYHDYNGSGITINDYKILEYIWDMGNGDHVSGEKVKYKYDKIGFYTIQLTVVGEHLTTGARRLFSAYKTYEVMGNYQTPNDFQKTLKDATK